MEKSIVFRSGRHKLAGVMHIPEIRRKSYPAVVMFHGFTGNKCESHFIFTKTARRLVLRGIAVLRFDFMGSGDSEGRFENMTLLTEINDGRKAMEFIRGNGMFDKNRLGVLGLSMGAVTASFVAAEYNIRSLVLWSPLAYTELIEQWLGKILTRKLKKNLLEKGKVYIPGVGHYLGRKIFNSLDTVKPLEHAGLYKGKVLVIHTKNDTSLPLKHSLAYFDAFHKNAVMPRIIILDEGGHTFTTEFSEQEVIGETVDFFFETLL